MIVIVGSSTPVRMKPMMAGVKFSPDSIPSMGGKIRLPAPKNIANSISPTAKIEAAGFTAPRPAAD